MTDAEIATLKNVIATLTAMLPAVVTPPVVVPTTIPTSSRPFSVTLLSVSGKTFTFQGDNSVEANMSQIAYPGGRTSVITSVTKADSGIWTATTSEAASDNAATVAAMVGKQGVIADSALYTASHPKSDPVVTTPPVVVPPVTSPVYLFGVNMSGLGNNPYVDNSIASMGTHYRDVEQKYVDKYKALGCKVVRLPIAPERCVDVNKGDLRSAYMAQIKAALDKFSAAGMKAAIDPHSYMRLYTTVSANAANTYGYDEKTFGGIRKLWIPVGAPGCLMDKAGYADFLTKLTAMFASHPGCAGIGIANEPFSRSQDPFNVVTQYLADAQYYKDAITASSKTCEIYVGGGEYCTALDWPTISDSLKNITDPYGQVIYEAHQYLDNGMHGGGNWSNRNEVIPVDNFVNMTKPFVDWLNTNKKRGVLGEFGHPAGNASANAATVKGLAYLVANGVAARQWCAGAGWSPDDVNAVDDDNLTYKDNLDPIKAIFGKTTTAYGVASA